MNHKSCRATFGVVPVFFLLALGLGFVPATAAENQATGSGGEVWLISTRSAPRSGNVDEGTAKIHYWLLDDNNEWVLADADSFTKTASADVPVTLFIHGNRTGRNGAIRAGWSLYRRLMRDAQGRPFRFVIWSWPSDQVGQSNRDDVRVKACRSDVQGYYLANQLQQFDGNVPVNLVGYSFGARVITGALHMLGGGRVAGRGLDNPVPRQRPFRAVLVAAAVDSDWLLPGRRNGLALLQVDRMLVTRNQADPVLRWYPLMYHIGGPRAMGYIGPSVCCGGEVEVLDVTRAVGRNHEWACYAAVSQLLDEAASVDTPADEDADVAELAPEEPRARLLGGIAAK